MELALWKKTAVHNNASADQKKVSKLVQDLSDPNETIRINSAYTLGSMGESAVTTLIESLEVRVTVIVSGHDQI